MVAGHSLAPGQVVTAAAARLSSAWPCRQLPLHAVRPVVAPAPLPPTGLAALSSVPQQGRWQQQRRRQRATGGLSCRAAAGVDVETARKLLDGPHTVLDIRPAREYDDSHITKPPRRSANIPFAAGQDGARFVAQVAAKFPSTAAKLIVMCADGGRDSAEATELLQGAAYSAAVQLEGGYAAYGKVWGPSGKRRPPSGRWVSTGKEALKSGLNIPGVAESYDEGGNLTTARWAQGLPEGEMLLEPWQQSQQGQQAQQQQGQGQQQEQRRQGW